MRRLLALACTLAMPLTLTPAHGGADESEVRIVRDGYGVPHVYSDTLEGVAYGAGYAIAEDRLFQLEVLRAVAKGRMTELFGPIPGFPEADAAARRLFYTDDERRAKLTRLSERAQRMYLAYVDGINDRLDEVRSDPSQLPQEYTTIGLGAPEGWDVTDSLAIADFLVETFGAGGGSELAQAELLEALLEEHDTDTALGTFDDIRWLNDPASPASIPADYDWRAEPSLAEDLPAKEWRRDARIGLAAAERAPIGTADPSDAEPQVGTLPQAGLVPDEPSAASQEALATHVEGLEKMRELMPFGSNAFVTGPDRTASGGTVQLGGPQVGQFAPQIIAEFGLHSPANDLDMTGLTFAGAGPAVLIGRTPFFAWTTTTGNSDGADIFVEELGPDDDRTYIHEGRVERMDCREETVNDQGGAPLRTEEVCRTRNGPVVGFDTDNGVAYAIRRSWFDMETGTVEGFFGANFVDDISDFSSSINQLQSNHNMFYVDADGNYGYWHPGAVPHRAEGTDVRLPQDGRFAATQWTRLHTAQEMPHAVNFDRGWLANWNNKPAVDWDNGDAANYGAVFRSEIWDELLAGEPAMSLERGNDFNRIAGTSELEWRFFRDHVVRAGKASDDEQIHEAAEALADWDAGREDTAGDGFVDSEPGYSLWKGWWRGLARGMAFDDFLNRVMRVNLDALADEYGTDDMAEWRAEMPTQHYTRLNVRFYDCEVARAAGPTAGCDDDLPGNVRELDAMNRGTYNHLVEFMPGSAPGLPELPEVGPSVEQRDGYRVAAGSIISPGQSGFINQAGMQDEHYEDQHELYASWEYKPMALREEDNLALGGDRVTALAYELNLDEVGRAGGPDRTETAALASEEAFESADTVVVAAAGNFPDALAAAPLAASLDAPLLLVGPRLGSATRSEIERLDASEAVIVGGRQAVSSEAESDLQAAGLETRRVSGDDRYATALGVPILLVEPDRVPAPTREALTELDVSATLVLGGTAAVSDAVADELPEPQRIFGDDRYGTSVAVARFGEGRGLGGEEVVVATGRAFPDGLAGGPVAAAGERLLVLVDGTRFTGADPVHGYLAHRHGELDAALVLGGPNAVTDAALRRVQLAISQR